MAVLSIIYLWLYSPLLGLGHFFSFFIFYTVCRTPWTGDQLVTRPLPTYRRAKTRNKRTQTSMPQVGFEYTIAVLERATTVHALDCAAIVIGTFHNTAKHLLSPSLPPYVSTAYLIPSEYVGKYRIVIPALCV
jgi:hypothetical protein